MQKQKNEGLQRKYLELQILAQQINQIQQQIANVQNQILELNSLKESLTSVKDVKENTESFVPVGFNIFTKAKLQNTNELLVNVGNNIFITKTIEETNSIIDSQLGQIQLIIKELEDKLSEFERNAELLQNEIITSSNK